MRLRPPRRAPEPDDTARTTVVDETAAPPPVVEEEVVPPPRRPPPPLLWPWLLLVPTDASKDGVVIDEQPAGSIRAPSGSSVAIYVGRLRR